MNYVMNEYSLRGQFPDVETFYDSVRNYTGPVLRKIQKEKGAVIWKHEAFWQQEVCPGIRLQDIRPNKNERSAELTRLKTLLQRLYVEKEFWSERDDIEVLAIRYCFDEEISNEFPVLNCFTKAFMLDGKMISFEHEQYFEPELVFYIEAEDGEQQCTIDNIYDINWWKEEPEIITWPRIKNLYRVQVRAREIDRHEPHFHVEYNEYAAVFAISDGHMIEQGKTEMPGNMIKMIKSWYEQNADALTSAWNRLHKPKF